MSKSHAQMEGDDFFFTKSREKDYIQQIEKLQETQRTLLEALRRIKSELCTSPPGPEESDECASRVEGMLDLSNDIAAIIDETLAKLGMKLNTVLAAAMNHIEWRGKT